MTETVGLTVPSQVITDLIKAEVVRTLGKTELFEQVIRQVLDGKSNSYDRDKWLESTLKAAIRGACEDAAKEWIEANREAIRIAFQKELAKRKTQEKLVNQFLSSMDKWNFSTHLSWRENG